MRVLLVRGVAPNERFGLGPFFRIESLGMEYIGAALLAEGHVVQLVDLRFRNLARTMASFRPRVVGVSAPHTLDTDEAIATARRAKACDPTVFTVLGGHAASVYPKPFLAEGVDAVCCEDGEEVAPALVNALDRGEPLAQVPGLWLRQGTTFIRTPPSPERVGLDRVPLPARQLMRPFQRHYLVVNKQPVWLVETARGCPYRCSFCTVWRHVDRSYRCRAIDSVCRDFAQVGDNVFVADDLFFHPLGPSVELAKALGARRARHPQELGARADAHRSGGRASRGRRGVARLLEGLRHFLRLRGADRSGPGRLQQGFGPRRDPRSGGRVSKTSGRHHRQFH